MVQRPQNVYQAYHFFNITQTARGCLFAAAVNHKLNDATYSELNGCQLTNQF